jgi:putative phosphoesterase
MSQTNLCNTVKVGVLSDTHSYLHPCVYDFFKDCYQIWHLGDVGNMEIIKYLEAFKPLKAVYGNIDSVELRTVLPAYSVFECGGLVVLLTHIGGYPPHFNAFSKSLIDKYKPDIFACGHSHILKVMHDANRNMLYINPGAAGNYGFHKAITFLRFDIVCRVPKNLEVFHQDKQ